MLIGAPGSLGDNEEELVPAQSARELRGAAAHVPLPEPFFNGLIAESLKLPAQTWKSTQDGLFAFDATGNSPNWERPERVPPTWTPSCARVADSPLTTLCVAEQTAAASGATGRPNCDHDVSSGL